MTMSYAISLQGRSALVTGASSGLGRAFAGMLARAGAAVALAARRRDSLEHVRHEIEQTGGKAVAVGMDVTNARSVAEGIREATQQLGRLDVLVNNAGVTLTKPFLDLDEAEWDRQLDTNLKGSFLVAQAAARVMRDQDTGGAIVNIASILGLRVAGQIAAYLSSKAGIVHLTRGMALELARHRIRVNALCPGYIETDLNRAFFASDTGRALVKRIPQRRLGQAAELEGPLLLMCSDAGSYMTGAVLAVDGGHLVSSL
jgi:NAD(P)-dependent dehydrogenase (short-subunit alcohol dehydrogenase family)